MHLPNSDEPGFGDTEENLYNLVYCSQAAPGIGPDAVDRIVESARRNNPAHAITGLLVFGGGVFFQWLEGPRAQVTALMAAIRADGRHTNVVELSATEEMRERVFPNWDMELVSPSDIHDVLSDALETAEDAQNAQALQRLMAQVDSVNPRPAGSA